MSTVTPGATIGVQGAFNTNPAYSGSFIPALWSGKLNAKFYTATVFGEIANTAWEGEISGIGDTIVINNIPDIAIQPYTPGQALNYQVPQPNTITMVVDQGQYFAFQVNDLLTMQSKPNLVDTFTNDASMQMKVRIDSSVLYNLLFNSTYGTIAAANAGAAAGKNSAAYNLGTASAPVTLTASNILALITSMSAVLDEQNVPETDRWLLIDPTTRQILMNSNIGQAQFMGDAQSVLRNGKIGMIDRFNVYVTNNLPRGAAGTNWTSADGLLGGGTLGGALKRRCVVAGHKTAMTFASQMTKMETVRNPNDFGDYIRGLNVYAHKLVKPEGVALAVVN
jgi:hypothetical protein